MRYPLALAFAAALAVATPGIADAAEAYPSRTITMSVPYAPGGPLDTLGRILAERMRVVLGQTIIIENVGGAGGSIGVGRVVRSAPDGYTIGAGNWGSHVANVAIYALPYDVQKDLDPVSLLPVEPNVIVARKGFPPNNLNELIAWLKQNPDAATAGTSGVGGPSHMSAIFFEQQTGTRLRLVPYRGAGPALQDLVAGQTDLMLTGPSIVLPHLQSGAIKAYAVTARARLTATPDIPTTDEAGLPGFYFSAWTALWVPKGTPGEIIARLAAAVRDVLADPALKPRLAGLGIEIPPADMLGPQPLRAFHKAEIEKWVPIIKAAGIKGE
jgi:tripartite-type tricarboxylate transporter receptor subunit TctC